MLLFSCVAEGLKYNLYFIVCSNLAMSERLPSGRLTKEQYFSRADNIKNTKSCISDPPFCDRPDDTHYVLDHTYALPIATEPYIMNLFRFILNCGRHWSGCSSKWSHIWIHPIWSCSIKPLLVKALSIFSVNPSSL